jgi:hypothetical protein
MDFLKGETQCMPLLWTGTCVIAQILGQVFSGPWLPQAPGPEAGHPWRVRQTPGPPVPHPCQVVASPTHVMALRPRHIDSQQSRWDVVWAAYPTIIDPLWSPAWLSPAAPAYTRHHLLPALPWTSAHGHHDTWTGKFQVGASIDLESHYSWCIVVQVRHVHPSTRKVGFWFF